MKRALVSVTDKTGVSELCSELVQLGYEIISTGGTYKVLEDSGIPVTAIDAHTGFPEMLDGRVKTLHPLVHGGILFKRDVPEHVRQTQEHGIGAIDMVVVNLYDFEGTLKSGKTHEEIVENIDIGGPSMIRSAAKNYRDVLVVTDPADYEGILRGLKHDNIQEEDRRRLAYKAFAMTAAYDAMISKYFMELEEDTFPAKLTMGFVRSQDLRYGENPHQQAAIYKNPMADTPLSTFKQLQGKELSFNNINDLNAALQLVTEFEMPAAVAVKHATPCGVAFGGDIWQAFNKAFEGDPVSIFGGIVALNRELDSKTAAFMKEIFLEIIAAPSFSQEALEILKEKKNLRLLTVDLEKSHSPLDIKVMDGLALVQEADTMNFEKLETVTDTPPTQTEMEDLKFAMVVCKHVKSNAIVLAKDGGTIGINGGQTARINALKNALTNGEERDFTGAVMASDAFFPFDDCVKLAGEYGISAIIQPGGSNRDQDSIDACNQLGIGMIFTGTRHFKH